jgi:hypothetical protein
MTKINFFPTIILLNLLITLSVLSETTVKLAIEPDVGTEKIPVNVVCPNINNNFKIEFIQGEMKFKKSNSLKYIEVKDRFLPDFSLSEVFAEGIYKVTDKSNLCYFTTVTSKESGINLFLDKSNKDKFKVKTAGKNWVVFEENIDNPSNSSSRQQDSGVGIGTFLTEDGKPIVTPRSSCYRPYEPFGITRYASGIVIWNRDDPIKAGYSIKDEKTNSEFVRSLRCPKGPNQSEFAVDGVYRILWDRLYGARTVKVPDHCTLSRVINSNNQRSWFCCCNQATSFATGLGCSTEDPRNLSGWPDYATSRCS